MQQQPASQLGDGCYHIFLDIGSSRGVHGRFLFEPEKYPDNGVSGIFDRAFGGDRKSSPICVFAFEPNPLHVESQRAIQAAYQRMGWRYTFINAAIGDADGNLTFYQNDAPSSGSEQRAFASWNHFPRRKSNAPLSIPAIDLVSWWKRHILNRRIPARSGGSQRPPTIVAKIDIEGMELPVLTRMVVSGVACQMHTVFLELHPWPVTLRNNVTLRSMKARQGYLATLNEVLSAGGCNTVWEHDSEEYMHDGVPLPRPLP